MVARHAVLLTPTKSSCPTQLPFYKQNASVSPLFAILTSPPQLAENTTTLSPFLATHTAPVPVTPLFATLTKTAGVAHPLFPFWNSPLATCRSPLSATEASHSARFSVRTPAKTKISFLYFNTLRTLLQLGGRGGVPYARLPLTLRPSPLLLCFHTLTNSFAPLKSATPLFSCYSKLLSKNTGGGHTPSRNALPPGPILLLSCPKTDHPPPCYTARRSLN